MRSSKFLLIFSILIFGFICFPVVITAVVSFNEAGSLTFPIKGFTLEFYQTVFSGKAFLRAFKNSFFIAVLSTFLALLTGIPAAYIMVKHKHSRIAKMRQLFFAPVIVPGIVLSYALYLTLIANMKLSGFTALVLAHTVVLFPYSIRVIGASLEDFNFEVEDAAESLGANRLTIFLKVILPGISSAIISTSILSFITSFNNVPVSLFLTDRKSNTLPLIMMDYVEYYFDPTVAALSVILIVLTLALMFVVEKTLGIKNYGG